MNLYLINILPLEVDKDAIAFGMAVAIGAVALPAVASAWCRGKKQTWPKPPDSSAEWKLVGKLANITLYPLKSAKGIDLLQANCTQLGIQQVETTNKLLLRDRHFMLCREDNGEKLTGVTLPNILQIRLEAETEESVRISYPNETDLIVNIPKQGKKLARLLRGEPVNCFDCGDEAALWLTRVTRGKETAEKEKTSVRLAYWPPTNTTRNLVGTYSEIFNDNVFKGVTNADGGAFSDFTSYMLMISSSVDELNRRTDDIEFTPRQFRPNFYVQSDQPPFSDLKWKWVKIGNVVFKYVKGCKRCAFTTYNPDTCSRYPNNEPLRTLSSIEEATCKEPIEESPMMGIHLGSYKPGTVHLGDPVYALEM